VGEETEVFDMGRLFYLVTRIEEFVERAETGVAIVKQVYGQEGLLTREDTPYFVMLVKLIQKKIKKIRALTSLQSLLDHYQAGQREK
jgi:hypothetical protein